MDFDDNLVLSSSNLYKLADKRTNSVISIEVLHRISPEAPDIFTAAPVTFYGIRSKKEYQGTGPTEEEALQNCINKISGVKQELIFPDQADKRRPQH